MLRALGFERDDRTRSKFPGRAREEYSYLQAERRVYSVLPELSRDSIEYAAVRITSAHLTDKICR
jgi:hypothetical protein